MNTGNILVFIGATLMMMAFTSSLDLCKHMHQNVMKASNFLKARLYWNPVVRLITEMSLEFFLVAMIDLYVQNLTSSGYRFSYALSIIALISTLGYLVVLNFYLWPKYNELKELKYLKHWGSFYEDYNLSSRKYALVQTGWFIIRRCLYAACTVFYADSFWLSLQVLFNSSIISVYILGSIKPYDTMSRNRLEIFNEFM